MTESFVPRTWIIASSLGLAVGIPSGLALGAPLEVVVGAMLVTPLMLGFAGLFLGTSQWLALRGSLERASRWVVLTVLGMGAGLTAAVVTVEQGGALVTEAPVRMATSGTLGLLLAVLVLGVVGGSVLGLAQSFALEHVRGARGRWVAASSAGLTGGFAGGVLAASLVGGLSSVPGLITFLVVSGAGYALVTGRQLEQLLAN